MNRDLYRKALDVWQRGTRRHYVYFILADGLPPAVKIGTTTDPDKRMSALRADDTKRPSSILTSSLSLLGWVEGDHELEKLLHRAFADERLIGEWFDYTAIRDDVDHLLARACLCRGCEMNRGHVAHL